LDAFETTFVPSASVFAWMRTRPASEPAPTLYLGVSDAGDDVLGRIDRATDEVATVARLLGTKNVLPNPTRDALLQFRRAHPRVRLLHLAMHAAPAQADDTFGLLIRDREGGADRLTAEDIATHLPVDADVVYIASCQSAPPVDSYAGFNAKLPAPGPCVCSYGESLSNVTAAFIANGTRHLVLTQYLIRDTPETVRVAELFFTSLRAGASPSAALRRVKRTMQRDTPVASWAGFMLVGD
ncbi:MAG TPA: CHAT domain-containing protein, partial [Thermoanaerobaculia bacterium]